MVSSSKSRSYLPKTLLRIAIRPYPDPSKELPQDGEGEGRGFGNWYISRSVKDRIEE